MIIPYVKNIIFDLDGVIADTDKGRFLLLKELLYEYDIEIERKNKLHDLEGISTLKFLSVYYPEISDFHSEIIRKRHEIYLSNLDKYCIPFPHAKKVISKLYLKYNLYLATTNDVEIARIIIKHIGVSEYFLNILGRDFTERKPENIKDYRLILNKLKLKSNKCIVIEDSQIGILAAKKEHIFCIAFNYNKNPEILNISDFSVTNYKEIEELLINGK